MKRVSIAECAVIVMNECDEYGLDTGYRFNSGCVGFLGEVYFKYVELNQVPKDKQLNHPLLRNKAVRDACRYTKQGRKFWQVVGRINYPAIINAPCDVFQLKEEYRTDKTS